MLSFSLKSHITFLLLICVFSTTRSQYHCNNKPTKFKKYTYGITSDQGGLHPNAYTVDEDNLQLESNLSLGMHFINDGAQPIKFDSLVFASVSQVRYGASSKIEVKLGYTYIYPEKHEADPGTHSQLMLGIKARTFYAEARNLEWNLSVSASYFVENISSGNPILPGGYYFYVHNSLKLYDIINWDITGGFMHNLNRNTMLGLINTHLMVKKKKSKLGFFMGFGGIFIESYSNIGVIYTDNYNFMMHFSLMSLDNAIALNLCYTHCFRE